MLPKLPKDHPHATIYNSFDCAKLHDSKVASNCATTVASAIDLYLLQKLIRTYRHAYPVFPKVGRNVDLHALVNKSVPVHAIKTKTEKLFVASTSWSSV